MATTRARPSARRIAAADLVMRIRALRRALDEVAARGGIVAVLNDGEVKEPARCAVVAALRRIQDHARNGVVAIGDDRRARGLAVPLCWLPPPGDGPPGA
jgi:hypothetical protein